MTFPRVDRGFGRWTAEHLNRAAELLDKLEIGSREADPDLPPPKKQRPHKFLAKIGVTNDGQPKRYQWIQADIDEDADTFIEKVSGLIRTSSTAASANDNYALNIDENDVSTGWVPEGSIVEMNAVHGDDGGIKYWFSYPQTTPLDFFARIVGVTGPFANRWLYTCTQVRETGIDANGLVIYEVDPDGVSVPATNPLEDGNNAAGTVAPGINLGNLPATFDLQPIGSDDGPIVLVRQQRATDGTDVFVIVPQSNTADGPCP